MFYLLADIVTRGSTTQVGFLPTSFQSQMLMLALCYLGGLARRNDGRRCRAVLLGACPLGIASGGGKRASNIAGTTMRFGFCIRFGCCGWYVRVAIRILPSPDPSSVYMIPFPDRGHHSTVTQTIVKSSLNIDSDLVKRG